MRYGTVDREFALRLATTPPEQDGPVLMFNFVRYRAVAEYGRDDEGGAAVSGREADERYAPIDVLAAIGASVAYAGDVPAGRGGPDRWDRVAIACYPTRRSFIEMQSRADFRERHVHKEAGVEFTINCTAVPEGPFTGTPGASGTVTFVLWPEGTEPPSLLAEGARFRVEGRILGDERRWGHVTVHFGDDVPVHEAAMVVPTVPRIERLRALVDGWGYA